MWLRDRVKDDIYAESLAVSRLVSTFSHMVGPTIVRQPAPLQPQLPPPVYNIGFGQTFKLDSTFYEVIALDFVRRHTFIPLPKVLGAWWRPNEIQKTATGEIYGCACYLLMPCIPGVTLGNAWPLMIDEDKLAVLRDLAEYMLNCAIYHRRRIMEAPSRLLLAMQCAIQVWQSGKQWDHSPFQEFVGSLMDIWIEDRPAKEERFKEILLRNLATAGVICTHADLNFNNIMVHKPSKANTYRVSGIVERTSA